MSIQFHHYKELKECISEVECIKTEVYAKKKELIITEEVPTMTLDGFLLSITQIPNKIPHLPQNEEEVALQ
jgi:hypothetical protein